jgi:hypothetical protein
MQPYTVIVLNMLENRNVAVLRTTIPVDKNNRFIIVLLESVISANLSCFTKTFCIWPGAVPDNIRHFNQLIRGLSFLSSPIF